MGETEQVEGHAPLLEPAVLVSQNCPECAGTGFKVKRQGGGAEQAWMNGDPLRLDVPKATAVCPRCEGAGREVSEVPMSEFVQLASASRQPLRAPSPSEMRRGG